MIGAPSWRTICALRNLLRAAHQDPLWAVTSVVLAPFHAGRYLAQAAFALLIFALVCFGAVSFAVDALGVATLGAILWLGIHYAHGRVPGW